MKDQVCHKKPKESEHEECYIDYEIILDVTYIENCHYVQKTHCEEEAQTVLHHSQLLVKNPKLLITMKRVTMGPNIITRDQQTPHIMDAREDTLLPTSVMIRWRKSARKTLLPTQRRSQKQFARRLLIQFSLKNVRKL